MARKVHHVIILSPGSSSLHSGTSSLTPPLPFIGCNSKFCFGLWSHTIAMDMP